MSIPVRPGGEMASRPLHFFWIVDRSGSMGQDGKIQALNTAVREAIPNMRSVADENPNAQVYVYVLEFSSGARWISADPVPLEQFNWQNLSADGVTDMGKALTMLADKLKMPPMPERALPPVLVLISDGQPTDDFNSGLRAVDAQPWGKKAVRIAIAIGGDADSEVLHKFMGGNPEMRPLAANNAEALASFIKWVSTAVVKSASAPPSMVSGSGPITNVPVPAPPTNASPVSADDVW